MAKLRTDANGHQLVHHDQRGLRLCEVCNLVMSEGYMVDGGDGYACSDACLVKAEWVIEQQDCPVFWTDWEGDGSPMPEEVADRLMLAPYNLTAEDIHKLGAHEDDADLSCKACSRLHRYEITVPTSIDRKYRVTAESVDQALEMYHTDADGVVFEEDDSSNSEEIIGLATAEEIG